MKRVAAALVAVLATAGTLVVDAPAGAAPPGDQEVIAFEVRGVGNGHGRGMSQWGALGRALAGQTWTQILGTYYQGTQPATRTEAHMRVRLTGWDGAGTVGVISAAGTARWNTNTTNYMSLKAERTSDNRFNVFGLTTARRCPGDVEASPAWQPLATNLAGPITFTTTANQDTAGPAEVLGLCRASGAVTHYRGRIDVMETEFGIRVVNDLDVENYLRGVIPKEVPASWGDQGGGKGMHALRAQAVAARSFGMSQARYAYAGTCDTSSCQVYGGAATRVTTVTNNFVRVEHVNTDQAIDDTPGAVRVWSGGAIVSTEFSASNGPRTAGGAFPPVNDPYDDQPGNPYHHWTRIIDADAIMSTYGLATANGVVTAPDADSAFDGIWANEVRLGNGTTVSAWNFRNDFGLPAPGYELVPIRRTVTGAATFAFIGDSVGASIAADSTSNLRVVTEGMFDTERFDAISSRRTQGGTIPDGVSAASNVPSGTDLVVVELGYNDDPALMAGRIDAVMAALRDRNVGQVLWVNVSERRDYPYDVTNAALQAATGRWSELGVLDWDAASSGSSANRWFTDDVHLSATGRAKFSLWLRDRILQVVVDGYTPPRALRAREVLRVPVLGRFGVPESGVSGVSLNVTAVGPAAAGWLRVWACGSGEPETSSVNFAFAGAVEPNAVVVPVDETGEVCVLSSSATDVVVDVGAWFDSGVRPATGRLVDTRGSNRLAAREVLRVPVLGRFGVPESGVSGVSLNVTAVGPAAAGWLRVWACGSGEPETSSVNFAFAGAVEPNAVVVPVDETGEVCVLSSSATDVVVDVGAWFDSGVRPATGRLVDTRGSNRLAAREVLRVPVLGRFGVPESGVSGVSLNVTAVGPAAAGWLRVWACGSGEPETSSVNFAFAGAVEPNAVVVPVDETGEVCVLSSSATDVVVDVGAWFDSGVREATGRIVDTRYGIGPGPGA